MPLKNRRLLCVTGRQGYCAMIAGSGPFRRNWPSVLKTIGVCNLSSVWALADNLSLISCSCGAFQMACAKHKSRDAVAHCGFVSLAKVECLL